jgi:hypothetical protein
MHEIVRACAGHVSTRTNSVCKELEPAGGTKSSAAVARDNAGSCAMRVSIRTSSVCKELGHVGATMKPADEGQGNRVLAGTPPGRRSTSGLRRILLISGLHRNPRMEFCFQKAKIVIA